MPPKNPPADKPETEKPDEGRMPLATKPEKPEDKLGDPPGGDRGHAGAEHDEKSPADKVAAEVEPKTDALSAIEALVTGIAIRFDDAVGGLGAEEAAARVSDLAEHFVGEARRLAEAALANVEEKFAAGTAERGYDAGLKPVADHGPAHNEHAVRSAVAHGMDEEKARAMTHSGANT